MSTTTTLSHPCIFSSLPAELLCEIFEHAAFCDNATALVLSLVSSWVRHLVEPLLYHTVVLSSARSLQTFLNTLSHKPASFASRRVKHLGIFAMGPAQSIIDVLETCQGVNSLACGFFLPGCKSLSTYDTTRMQALDCTKEQHLLGMSCRDGWDASVVGPSVTHLRVHLPASSMSTMFPTAAAAPHDDDEELAGWERLSQLPALTHLAIVYRPSQRYPILTIFEHLQRLVAPHESLQSQSQTQSLVTRAMLPKPDIQLILVQVVGTSVVQSPAIEELNDLALATGGSSLRIVAERAPLSAVCQWEEAVREGRTVWQHAEQVVEQRLVSIASQA